MYNPIKEKEEARKGLFKKGVTAEDARKKRTDLSNQIRKEKKETRIAKKRQQIDQSEVPQINNVTASKIQAIASDIISNKENLYDLVKQIRQILSIERSPPIAEVILSGVVPYLVKFLSYSSNPQLQLESAWALTNIASGTTQQTQFVVENNAIPAFVELINSNEYNLVEQAIWALGNIAGDSAKSRDLVIQNNALPVILQQIQSRLTDSSNLSLIRNATWTVSNLCRGKPQPDFVRVSIALPVLARLIQSNDRDIVADACWAISYLSDGDNKQIETVMSSGICNQLVYLLSSPYINIITPALRAIGNFVTGDDKETQQVLDANVLPSLLHLLSNNKPTIVKEACWTISNIAAGTQTQVQLLFTENIMPTIINLLSKSYVIKKEAAWVIANATTQDNPTNIQTLVSFGVIPALCDALNLPDIEVKEVVLNALNHILRVGLIVQRSAGSDCNPYVKYIIQCGGGDILESLQDHPNHSIADKVVKLIKAYFPIEDDEDDSNVQPTATQTGFAFGMPAAPSIINNNNNNNTGTNTFPNNMFQGF